MPTDIVIPSMGESISEGVISSWLKEEGAYVQRDEEVLELETDKVNSTILAPAAGVLRHRVKQGDTVRIGAVVGIVDESATAPAAAPAPKPAAPAAAPTPSKATAPAPEAKPAARPEPAPVHAAPAPAAPADDDHRATPLARKIADENKVDLNKVTATGPGGRVREQDVLAFIQARQAGGPAKPAAASAPTADRAVRRERMTPLRQRVAQRLVESKLTTAMLTTFNECDMTAVMALRNKHKDSFEKTHGVKLGFMSFFVKAAVSALKKVPVLNAYVVDGDDGKPAIEFHDYCDIAIAVQTEKGLTVPVLRNADRLSFAEIERGIMDLATRARDGKLTLEDLQGGTFTVSNGGIYGSMMSTPILNPPQSGILGMHNIIRRPVENPDKPGSGEVVVRPMMYLAMSYDHRIVDGEGSVTFLKHVKECIEDPSRLMFGV